MRKKVCVLILLLLVSIGFKPVYTLQELNNSSIKAESAILVNVSNGQILYEKEPFKKLHISSASKIMTALIATERLSLNSSVTISRMGAIDDNTHPRLEVGEKYTVEELLYLSILTSSNTAANALAEAVSSDKDTFVALMNSKAASLNMKETKFVNPTGLYNEEQYTTAYDLSILLRNVLRNSFLNHLLSVQARPFEAPSGTQVLLSRNKLFWSYEGVDGGRVGYNDINKQTAITTATRQGLRLMSIVLNAEEDVIFQDSKALLDYGFSNFKRSNLVTKGQFLKEIQIGNNSLNLISTEDVYYVHPIGESYIRSIEFKVNSNLSMPIKRDASLGVARYILEDGTNININLYPEEELYSRVGIISKIIDRLLDYRELAILLVILLTIEMLLILMKLGQKFFKA